MAVRVARFSYGFFSIEVSSVFTSSFSFWFQIFVTMSSNTLRQFKKDHPTYQLMVDEIEKHAADSSTISAIADGTYQRPKPKEIYSKHETSLRDYFGEEWQKKAQNAVNYIMKSCDLPTLHTMKKKGQG